MYLGDFELETKCMTKGCKDVASRILVLFEPDTEEMTVRCLCLPHALYHKSLFEERTRN